MKSMLKNVGWLLTLGVIAAGCANGASAPNPQATDDIAVAATITAAAIMNATVELTPTATPSPLGIGEQISTVRGTSGLLFSLDGCFTSVDIVRGPYSSGHYTFTAMPGMRFISVDFTFTNDGVRQLNTPYLDAGEVSTHVGRFYRVWSPPTGIFSTEYEPRPSRDTEVSERFVASGAFETLLPGRAVQGRFTFEIPFDEELRVAIVDQIPIALDLSLCMPMIESDG